VITIYTGPDCEPCKMAKRFFARKGVDYNEVKLSEQEAQMSVIPQVIWPNGEITVGLDTRKYKKMLAQFGGIYYESR